MQTVYGPCVVVVVGDFQVGQPKRHLQFDGKFYIAEIAVETYAGGVAEIVGVESYYGLVAVVLIVAERSEVKAVTGTRRQLGTEIAPAKGSEFQVDGYFAIHRLYIPVIVNDRMQVQVVFCPGVIHASVDDCQSGSGPEVEIIVQSQVDNHCQMEAGIVVRGGPSHGLPDLLFFRKMEVEF